MPCFTSRVLCTAQGNRWARIIVRLRPVSLVLHVLLGRQTGRQQQRHPRRLMELVTGEANQNAVNSYCVNLLLPRLSHRLRLPVIRRINSLHRRCGHCRRLGAANANVPLSRGSTMALDRAIIACFQGPRKAVEIIW